MIKVGIADYGMYVWYGGLFDYQERLLDLKSIGYDGLERLRPISEADAIHKAAMVKRLGMDFATCLAPDIEHSIAWTAALSKHYVWTNVTGKDFDSFCRQVNEQTKITAQYGIESGLHNHMGSLVETQDELLRFLDNCPDCGLVLDTGHLATAEGGDPLAIVDEHFDRIVAVHLKEWVSTDSSAEKWHDRGYFTGLGEGNFPIENEKIVKRLVEKGYDKWIFIEHDTHLQEPLIDLKKSREILKSWGI